MQEFIARRNLELFERKLAEARNQHERDVLSALIRQEREQLRQLTGASPPDMA